MKKNLKNYVKTAMGTLLLLIPANYFYVHTDEYITRGSQEFIEKREEILLEYNFKEDSIKNEYKLKIDSLKENLRMNLNNLREEYKINP